MPVAEVSASVTMTGADFWLQHDAGLFDAQQIDIDMRPHPDLKAQFNESFDGLVEGLRPFMPEASEKDIKIKAVNIWASVHGLVGILRRDDWQANKIESLEWIENNLEEYLQLTTFR